MENASIAGPLGLSPYTAPASLLHPLAAGFPHLRFIVFSTPRLDFGLVIPSFFFLIFSPHSFLYFYLIKI